MLQKSQVIVALVVPLVVCSPLAASHELQRLQEALVSHRAEGTGKSEGGPPQELKALPLSSSELIVSWSHPDIVPIYYRVQVSSPYKDEITYNTFHIINELEPCTSYTVQVSSVYGNDNTYPDTTAGTTGSIVPPPPQSCTFKDVTSTSMRVMWDAPNTMCQINNYNVSWTYDVLWSEEQGSDHIIMTGTEFSHGQLTPYTNYVYNIAASTDAGYGKPVTCSQTTLQ